VVPHIEVKRWICLSERTGMMPGTMGPDPGLPAALDEPVVGLVVEEELRRDEGGARVDLALQVPEVRLGDGASGCFSG
jgi:hypothetical protein